jgi:hypothetical protein
VEDDASLVAMNPRRCTCVFRCALYGGGNHSDKICPLVRAGFVPEVVCCVIRVMAKTIMRKTVRHNRTGGL